MSMLPITRINNADMWRRLLGDKCAAPLIAWRTTNISTNMASRLRMVSSRLSPLDVEEVEMLILNTSADKALGGKFKGSPCPRAVFKKKIDYCLATQQRHFFNLLIIHADKRFGNIQNFCQQAFVQTFNGQKCLSLPSEFNWRLSVIVYAAASIVCR